ncbi:MAG TPA: di-heme-cytochrome C peroxidase [Allosphingosinicella sp.]|nr:di-heme-cytochrome C peroxidase [Allosphingosinicella sp.]
MRSTRFRILLKLTAAALACSAGAAAAAGPVFLHQGSSWTPAARADFYTRDQGSRLIPYAWAKALKAPGGAPFLADGLARYGYLPNPANANGLPVGFMTGSYDGKPFLAMNCSACHTRQIVVGSTEYRVDGGPALVDFQALLADLDSALGAVLATDSAFATFAAQVLGPGAPPAKIAALKQEVAAWHLREHTLVTRALPPQGWGLGRLDAVSMIFNRLVGMDIGPPPSFLIPGNIALADAPVRYPFLWNAPKQDRTQWPGFSKNGDDLFALTRNLGQVYGVFGIFRPSRQGNHVDFLAGNSIQWKNLGHIENLVRKIGPPRWPWALDPGLVDDGRRIYERKTSDGGCAECHGKRPGAFRFVPPSSTWATPLCDVGTDSREYAILKRTVESGVFQGAKAPVGSAIGATSDTFSLLGVSVIGAIFQQAFGVSLFKYGSEAPAVTPKKHKQAADQLLATYKPAAPDVCGGKGGPIKYESRVMHGIWAAAPYLHNGSVPTLADLLKAPRNRPDKFEVGNRYDTALVGLARDQGAGAEKRNTRGCSEDDVKSGESRCGHDFGTDLSDSEKKALLEYLKAI